LEKSLISNLNQVDQKSWSMSKIEKNMFNSILITFSKNSAKDN